MVIDYNMSQGDAKPPYVYEQRVSPIKNSRITLIAQYNEYTRLKDEETNIEFFFYEKESNLELITSITPEEVSGFIDLLLYLQVKKVTANFSCGNKPSIIEENRKSFHLFLDVLSATNISSLKLTSVSGCTENEIQHLTNTLMQSNITELEIHNMDPNNQLAEILANGLPNTKITKLNLSHNELGNEGFCTIAKILPFSKIEELDFNNDRVQIIQKIKKGIHYDYHQGISAICDAIRASNVRSLNLQWLDISQDSCRAIIEMIQHSNLQELYLHTCLKNTQSMELFLAAIKDSNLKKLSLHAIQGPTEQLVRLIKEISFSKIEELELVDCLVFLNIFNTPEVEEFIEVCSQSTNLRKISLKVEDTYLGEKICAEIKTRLKAYNIDINIQRERAR